MQGLVNTGVRGYKMTGLFLNQGRTFIGLSRCLSPVTNPAKLLQKARIVWFNRGEHWTKAGFVGRGESWFFGISFANADKTVKPQVTEASQAIALDDDLSPEAQSGSLAHG
jgi:hypothetical protein